MPVTSKNRQTFQNLTRIIKSPEEVLIMKKGKFNVCPTSAEKEEEQQSSDEDEIYEMMDFDEILEELGELGKYQIIIYLLLCLPVLFAAANSLSYVFTAGVPNYRCFIPSCDNISEPHYDETWVKWTVPQLSDENQVIGFKKDSCDRFSLNKTAWNLNQTCATELFDTNAVEKCSEWIFDNSERTIVNEWNITCSENQWKLSLVGSSHFAGIIIGSAFFGILADRFGRKLIFIFCIILMCASGVAQIFSPEYITFVTLIFLNALGTAGVYPLAFILGLEMVGKRKREITGIVLNYFYAIGELIAWIAKDWKILQLIVSGPSIVFIIYYWFIPESVRWLLANSRREEAKTIVVTVAKVNKVTLTQAILDSFTDRFTQNSIPLEPRKDKIWLLVKEMSKSKKLILRFSIVYFIWAVNAFVYYGLSINSTTLSGDKYLNFALVSLVEIPGYSLSWIFIQKFGRKPSLVLSLLLCGITCTLTIFISKGDAEWVVISLFLTGKLAITAAFGIVYVHTSEMLPTIIRSGGVGTASTFARVGALLSPFVALLGSYYTPLPMLMFGGLGIVAGLLATKLPETLGTKLPETVSEAEML